MRKQSKPYKYWASWENLEKELTPIITQLGYFPPVSELRKLKRWDIVYAISRCHGGIFKVAERLSYKLNYKPPNYWLSFDNLKQELQPIVNRLGYFPSSAELRRMGREDINRAISQWHGGVKRVREILGCFPSPYLLMRRTSILPKEELEKLYLKERLSQTEIAKIKGLQQRTVARYMEIYGITPRSLNEVQKLYYSKHPLVRISPDLNPSPELAYVLGVINGDGFVYLEARKSQGSRPRGVVGLEVKNKEFAESFVKALGKIGLNPFISLTTHKPDRKNTYYRVFAYSIVFAQWYKNQK